MGPYDGGGAVRLLPAVRLGADVEKDGRPRSRVPTLSWETSGRMLAALLNMLVGIQWQVRVGGR